MKHSLMIQKSSIQFLINIVEDIMDMSKFQFGQFTINSTWFNFNEVVDEIFEITTFLADQKKIKLIKNVEIDPLILLYSDKKRLKQVLLNLVTNALKFTHTGFVKVRAYILNQPYTESSEWKSAKDADNFFQDFDDRQIDAEFLKSSSLCEFNLQSSALSDNQRNHSEFMDGKQQLVVEVIDTGIGINRIDQMNLFKVFGKIKSSNCINKQGVGLGLNICKKICEFLGGQITIKSEEDQGSTFTFTINIDKIKNCANPTYSTHKQLNCSHQIIEFDMKKYQSKSFFHNPFSDKADSLAMKLSPSTQATNRKIKTYDHHPLFGINRKQNSQIPSKQKSDNSVDEIRQILKQTCGAQECRSILVVDDNYFNIMAMKMMLEEAFNKQGIKQVPQIDSAINGLEGINKMIEKAALSCCKVPYKLILIDLNMPKMGGLQMIKNIRENIFNKGSLQCYKDSMFVLCTAENEECSAPYKDLGFDSFSKFQVNFLHYIQ
eukprot:403339079